MNHSINFHKKLPENILHNLSAILIDAKVKKLHFPTLSLPHLEIHAMEKHKSLDTLQKIWNFFYEQNLDRHSTLGIIGGGLTLDVGNFAASVWMRGIPTVLFPTTLLAQVDASIGGKTAVNFKNIKNLLGTFYPPRRIVVSYHFLNTLEEKQIRSGFAEMLKHALIASPELYRKFLEIPPCSLEKLIPLIRESANLKQQIVLQDPLEKGIRKHLNFGHTFGHAIEMLTGIEHGEAVALGILVAAAFSVKLLNFPYQDFLSLQKILMRWRFPVELLEKFSWQDIETYIRRDKKKKHRKIRFVFLKKIGSPVVMEAAFSEKKQGGL